MQTQKTLVKLDSSPMLKIQTLGTLTLTLDGKPLAGLVSQRKSEALIVYLALNPRPHRRLALASLFWGNYPESRALNNLSVLLSTIKKHVGALIHSNRQHIQINTEADYSLDVNAFLSVSDLLKVDQLKASEFEQLSQTVALYQGDFLSNFYLPESSDFETWLNLERERYRQLALKTLNRLLSTHQNQANYPEGISLAYKTLELDPLDEHVNYQLIHMLALSGQKRQAISHFEYYAQLLDQELSLTPEQQLYKLVEGIKEGRIRKFQEATPETSEATSESNGLSQYIRLERLSSLSQRTLFGLGTVREHLGQALNNQTYPYLIAIVGMGGLGKTTLAHQLCQDAIDHSRPKPFDDFAWVSAKQEDFLLMDGLSNTGRPALDRQSLIHLLIEQLDSQQSQASPEEQEMALKTLLKTKAHLVIVDNLETVYDVQEIVPLLRQLSNPSKILLTSRFALKNHSDIYTFNLNELSQEDSFSLLRFEAKQQTEHPLQQATPKQLEAIYQVVGGNPLALKLVVGQLSFLSLKQVLKQLQEARGKRNEALYSYMYWQTWQMLDTHAQQLFLAMPTVPNGTFEQLGSASMLTPEAVQNALSQLLRLSLIQVSGDLQKRRYRLHRLTETFLMQEVVKWQR